MDQRILSHLSGVTEEEQRILRGEITIDRSLYMDGSLDMISGSKLLPVGKQIAIRPHTRFVRFPEHTHDYVEIVYMCQGSTRHIVNGSPLVLRQGELLMMGLHIRQAIEPAAETDIAVNFIVRPDFFHGILAFLGHEETPLRRFVLESLSGGSGTGFLHFRVADVLPVQNLVENLLWTLIADTGNKRGIHQLTMGLLFAELLEHTDALAFSTLEEQAVVRTLRYIEEHYRDSCLTDLAAALRYDLSALSRLIRRETGKSYTELLQEKRLSQAAWFLANTDRQVEEIAHLVGYENSSYFHRLFYARFGLSPRHYRLKTAGVRANK